MYRIENNYGKTMVKIDNVNTAIKMAIELGKDRINLLINDSNQTGLPFNGDIQVQYYPESIKMKDYACFTVSIEDYDDEENCVVETRYQVIFEG